MSVPMPDEIDDVTLMLMADGALAAGQQGAVAAALGFDPALKARFDALVRSAEILAVARRAAPPAPVPLALAARIARPPVPAGRVWAAVAAAAVLALSAYLLLAAPPSAPAYLPAGGQGEEGVPETLDLPDGATLRAEAGAALPGDCRLMRSSDRATAALVCRSTDGTLQTVFVAP